MLHSISQIRSLAAYVRENIALSDIELYNCWIRETDQSVHCADTVSYYIELIRTIRANQTGV